MISILKSIKKTFSGKKASKTPAGSRCGCSSKAKKASKSKKFGVLSVFRSLKRSKSEKRADKERLNGSVSGVGGTSYCDDDGRPGNCYLIYQD